VQLSLSILRRLADADNPNSFASRLRAKRFRQFEQWIAPLPRPLQILDLGGTNAYWERNGWASRADTHIVTLNPEAEEHRYQNIEPLVGDAMNLERFGDQSFDVVFSNSVIEHLFTFENQRHWASEVQRIGKCFWVQSPNYWFPMEPHFDVPGWQWLPLDLRVAMIQRWKCGSSGPCADPVHAREIVEEVRLLSKRELKKIFPGAALLPQRFCGLVKSWNVIRGLSVLS
jgi:Methyltransferase domain